MKKLEISQLKVGDILSESSHYIVNSLPSGGAVSVKHVESNTIVKIGVDYIDNLIDSADQFTQVIEVGKEDKLWTTKQIETAQKEGDLLTSGVIPNVGDVRLPGIRTIWENIHSAQIFTVCFKKVDKAKAKSAYVYELTKQREEAITLIEKAKAQKKSMAEAYKIALEAIQLNPVKDYIEGEERVLRGYKVQFISRDGRYDCIDLDIESTGKDSSIRPVNINTIAWLIFDGKKYVVK